jgi:hypothetical protein
MPKRIADEQRRVSLNCLISPETKATIDRLRCEHSQGEMVDVAVAAYCSPAFQRSLTVGEPVAPKLSKKAQAAEARKAADPLAQALGRTDIDYMNPDELPSAGSVGFNRVPANLPPAIVDDRPIQIWRANRKPLLKPGDAKR